MKITLIRHGETEMNVLGKTNGQRIEDHLTEVGRKQIEKVAESLPRYFDIIIASDLHRTQETAAIVAANLEKEVVYRKELREIDLGNLTGLSWAEITEAHGEEMLRDYLHQVYNFHPYGGEEIGDVKGRIFACFEMVKENYQGKEVLVVTHGGIIRMLHFFLHGKLFEVIENGAVHEFEV